MSTIVTGHKHTSKANIEIGVVMDIKSESRPSGFLHNRWLVVALLFFIAIAVVALSNTFGFDLAAHPVVFLFGALTIGLILATLKFLGSNK